VKNGLHRHYDRLSGEERFRLDVLAMARGDTRESERLVSSCPRATYTMTDRAFGGRWTAARNATGGLQVLCAEQIGKLATVDVVRAMLPYSRALYGNLASDAYSAGLSAGGREPNEDGPWSCGRATRPFAREAWACPRGRRRRPSWAPWSPA
jgi:hypothetical protein